MNVKKNNIQMDRWTSLIHKPELQFGQKYTEEY